MLIVLSMLFLVSAEWVEISQNHYRKEPFRNVLSDLAMNKNNIYNNHSITEHQWSKGYVDRVSGIGNVQGQRIQEVERKPLMKIERNSFHREDFITMVTPENRHTKINGLKSENSDRNKMKYENRNNAASVQRIQETTVSGERLIDDKNLSSNKLVTNNYDRYLESQKINSNKLTATETFQTIKSESENISETLQLDALEAFGVNSQMETTTRNSQEKSKKISNDNQNYLPPKDDSKRNETKNNGLDTLLKVIKIVSQTIKRGTRRNFIGKVRYLEDLKMSLLTSIEERIESAFPDEIVKQRRRRSSGFHDSRGHVEFPSSESALMTISFLTFAVFLIKLVLQVIHTYKAKTMMVTPAVVATVGRAGKVFRVPSNN